MPRAATIAFLVNPSNPATDGKELQEAASALGRPLHILPASTESDINAAFLTLAEVRLGGLIVSADPFFDDGGRAQIVGLARTVDFPLSIGSVSMPWMVA